MAISSRSVAVDEDRPLALLFVYSWDMLRAIFALLGAMVSFAGGISANGKIIEVPGYVQAIYALSYVSFAASLIVVAVVLARRQRWVRQAQNISLLVAIGLIVSSVLAQRITDPAALAGNAAFILVDVAALAVMNGKRLTSWYTEPGRLPRYMVGTLVFWAAANATQVIYVATGGIH